MREITETFTVYKFSDAPDDVKEKITEYFKDDHSFYDHCMVERIETLRALAKYCNATLNYSISCVPDRSEFITIVCPSDARNDINRILKELFQETDSCPLTGVCYDDDLIDDIKKGGATIKSLQDALNKYIESIHSEYDSMLDDDYLSDHCEANEYEFYENGEMYV